MNLTNAYTLSQELMESKDKLAKNQHDLNGIKASQTVFTIATYFIYFSFTAVIFAGVTVWNLQSYIFDNYTNVIGMVWALVTVFAVPLALSLAKHFNYKAIALNSVERGNRGQLIIHAIIALALISGLYYEAISSSSNLQAKAFHSVENSKAGASIMNTSVASSSGGAIAGLIADAEFKLAGCERRLKEGSVKDCNNSQAKVDSLKAQAQYERESVASANVAAIGAKQEALDKERDSHALPAAKWAAELMNMSNDAGTMIIVIIAALFFELIHITTIFNEARALRGIDTHTAALKQLNGEYFKATGKTFDAGDFKDNRTIDLSDKPLNVPNTPMDNQGADFTVTTKGQPYKESKAGFGFAPSPANARFKWQDSDIELPAKPEKQFGFIPTRNSDSLAVQNRKDYPQEIVMPTIPRPTPDDYAPVKRVDLTARERLRNGEKVYPTGSLDEPTKPTLTPLQLPVLQLPVREGANSGKSSVYAMAEQAKVGQVIACPCCEKSFTKANKWHLFCSNNRKPREDGGNCSDDWHNAQNPERLAAAQAKARKRKG